MEIETAKMLSQHPKPWREAAVYKTCDKRKVAICPWIFHFIIKLFIYALKTWVTIMSFNISFHFLKTCLMVEWHHIFNQKFFSVRRKFQNSFIMVWPIFNFTQIINRVKIFFARHRIFLQKSPQKLMTLQFVQFCLI